MWERDTTRIYRRGATVGGVGLGFHSSAILIDSRFSTVVCAPVFTRGEALATQIPVGPEEGLRHGSWVMCDNLVSLPRSELKDYLGRLPPPKIRALDRALRIALDLA